MESRIACRCLSGSAGVARGTELTGAGPFLRRIVPATARRAVGRNCPAVGCECRAGGAGHGICARARAVVARFAGGTFGPIAGGGIGARVTAPIASLVVVVDRYRNLQECVIFYTSFVTFKDQSHKEGLSVVGRFGTSLVL